MLDITQGIEAKFNLIVFNPHTGTRFRASTPEAVAAFRSVLIAGGRVCTVRDSRGDDEVRRVESLAMYWCSCCVLTCCAHMCTQMAACGQLGNLDVTAAAGRTPAPLLDPPASLAHVLGPE